MKRKQIKELAIKTKIELMTLLGKEEEDLAKLLLEKKARRLKNVALVSEKKKDIARIKTFLRDLELTKHENV